MPALPATEANQHIELTPRKVQPAKVPSPEVDDRFSERRAKRFARVQRRDFSGPGGVSINAVAETDNKRINESTFLSDLLLVSPDFNPPVIDILLHLTPTEPNPSDGSAAVVRRRVKHRAVDEVSKQ